MTTVTPLATTVSNLVVSPSTYGCSVTCTTDAAVRAQLKWGPSSGSYPSASAIESMPSNTHGAATLLCAYGLTPSTTYHYILQWYDASGNALDATADATFTTTAAPTPPAGGMGITGPLTVAQGTSPGAATITSLSANLALLASSGQILYLGANYTVQWVIQGNGTLQTATDNAWDIGASGANRPRNIYAAAQFVSGNGNFVNANGSAIYMGQSGAPSAGVGNNGDYYFRTDTPGTSLQRIYVKSGGAWVGVV